MPRNRAAATGGSSLGEEIPRDFGVGIDPTYFSVSRPAKPYALLRPDVVAWRVF